MFAPGCTGQGALFCWHLPLYLKNRLLIAILHAVADANAHTGGDADKGCITGANNPQGILACT